MTARVLIALVLPLMIATSASVASQASAPAAQSSVAYQATSPEEELVQRYAPIAMLKRQDGECDRNGEPYLPVPVEVVLGDPEVALKQNLGGEVDDDPIVTMGPTAADLFGKDDSFYLDLPGNPRAPGCDYERFSKTRMEGRTPTTYAHIVVSPDGEGLRATGNRERPYLVGPPILSTATRCSPVTVASRQAYCRTL